MGQFKLKTTTSSTNTLQRFIPNEHPCSHSGLCSCCSHAGLGYQKFLPPPLSFPGSVHELCYLSTNFQCDLCRRRLTGAIALTSARRAPAVRPRRYHVRSLLNYNYETTNPLIVPPYGLCLDTCHRHMNRVISQEAVCALLASSRPWQQSWQTGKKKNDFNTSAAARLLDSQDKQIYFLGCGETFFCFVMQSLLLFFCEIISQSVLAIRRR